MFFISVTAHLHNSCAKLHFVHLNVWHQSKAPLSPCDDIKGTFLQTKMDSSTQLYDGLLTSALILSRAPPLKAIQTSAPHINNFHFFFTHSVLHQCPPPHSEWLQTPFPPGPPDVQWHAALRSQLFGVRGSRVGGKRSGEGRSGSERVSAEARGLDTSPRSSLSSHLELSKHLLKIGGAGQ